jgi:excisionase family DNA binding protein
MSDQTPTVRLDPPFTVSEALEYLKISRPTLYKLAHEDQIRLVKIGRSTRIPAADIYTIAGFEATR